LFLLISLINWSQILEYQEKLEFNCLTFEQLLQIRTNWVRQNTGQLSKASSVAMTLRTIGRLATSVIETGDIYLILRYAILTFLNAIILTQIVLCDANRSRRLDTKST
jgi:hypothetical protein